VPKRNVRCSYQSTSTGEVVENKSYVLLLMRVSIAGRNTGTYNESCRRQILNIPQSDDNAAMPFVDLPAVSHFGRVVNLSDQTPKRQYRPGRPLQYGLLLPTKVWATEAARHVRDEELQSLLARHLRIDKREALPSSLSINAPDKVLTDATRNHHEAVADLNGLAVTAAFEWTFAHTLSAFGYRSSQPPDVPADAASQAIWLTHEAARHEAKTSNFRSRLLQMGKHAFDWLSPHLAAATQRLESELRADDALRSGTRLQFEVPLKLQLKVPELDSRLAQETELVGRPDIVHTVGRGSKATVTIWEIKFVGALAPEHVVQAVTYGALRSVDWICLSLTPS
jgi:hypothetical protein